MECLAGKTVGILAEFNVEDLEFHYPALRFREEGCLVKLIGPTSDFQGKGKYGLPIKANTGVADVEAKELDCLIIPGGFAPDYWRRSDAFKNIVKDMHDLGKPIGAICHGPWLLVSAKVASGKRMTCFHAIKDDVINAGAEYVEGQEVVIDGNIVTSRTPDDLPAFCKALINLMVHFDEAEVGFMFPWNNGLSEKVPFKFVVAKFVEVGLVPVVVLVIVVLFDVASMEVLVAMLKMETPTSNLHPTRISTLARCCCSYEQILVLSSQSSYL
eukprot:gene4429-8542_t